MTKYLKLEADRELLNPDFESYKLSTSESEAPQHHCIKLPCEAQSSCAILDDASELQLLAYRMHLNSLFQNPFSPYEALFFDDKHGIWKILLGEEEVVEQVVVGNPTLAASSRSASLVFLNDRTILVSRGASSGSLELLSLTDDFPIKTVPIPWAQEDEFLMRRLVDVSNVMGDVAIIAVVEVSRDPDACLSTQSIFLVHILQLNLVTLQTKVLMRYQSTSRPVHIQIDHEGIFIASTRPFVPQGLVPSVTGPTEPNTEDADIAAALKQETLQTVEEDDDGQFAADSELNSVTLVKYLCKDLATAEWQTHHVPFVGTYVNTKAWCNPSKDTTVLVAVSHADDVLAFAIQGDSAKHIQTYDAMAFVQASKQDRRYVLFLPQESLVIESSRYVFVYKRSEERRAQKSKQFLVDLGSAEAIIGWTVMGDNLLVLLTRTACHAVVL